MRSALDHPDIAAAAVRHPMGPSTGRRESVEFGLTTPLFAAFGAAEIWIRPCANSQESLNPRTDPLAAALRRRGLVLTWKALLTHPPGLLGLLLLTLGLPIGLLVLPCVALILTLHPHDLHQITHGLPRPHQLLLDESADWLSVWDLVLCIPILIAALALLGPMALLETAAEHADLTWRLDAPSSQEQLDAMVAALEA